MKIEEALKILDEYAGWEPDCIPGEYYEAMDIVCEAAKKQIPKKPILKLHKNRVPGEQEEYYCPYCDEWITWDYKWKFCAECGQAIKWQEDKA